MRFASLTAGCTLTAALTVSPTAGAQGDVAPAADAVQSIEVTGSHIEDDRRDAPNAKHVVTRNDIERFGDQRLGDVLKRVPGLSVTGGGAQAGEIRMRGLGNGYTQILIDGEPVPQGFSLDGLSPSLIERVEVLRSGTADLGGQGIAGTINIILRRASGSKPATEASTSLATSRGLGSGEFTVGHNRKADRSSYGLSLSVARERNEWPATTDQRSVHASGIDDYAWHTDSVVNGTTTSIGLNPRFQWQDDQHKVQSDGLLEWRESNYLAIDRRITDFGPSPTFAFDQIETKHSVRHMKGSLTYTGRVTADNRLEAKLSMARFARASDSVLDGEEPIGRPVLRRTVTSDLTDDSGTLKVSDKLALGDDHSLATGIEAMRGRRQETRIQRDKSDVGYPITDLDEDFTATIDKWAAYVQDEWTPSEALSIYAGVRHEQLDTDVHGPTLEPIVRKSSATSPALQVVWKINKSDQLRLAWGRSYKPPQARDLVPRRWVIYENSAANPNFEGNPALLPEVSENIDAGVERYLPNGGFLGANFYSRLIRDVVLTSVFQRDGVWIAVPVNGDRARTYGVELEAKGKVSTGWQAVPQIDLRSGLGLNRSHISGVPGNHNRLAQQPRTSMTLGADLPIAGGMWKLGASFNYESGGPSRTGVSQTLDRSLQRKLDAYVTWTPTSDLTLRLSFSNLLTPDSRATTVYEDDDLMQQQIERRPNDIAARLKVEARF